ncbi:cytochrome-c oxidase/ electron carrier [Rhynchospora pubera]|uniref:Cytochrome-c oxidase/ electron carrier n=1 Tax=Rhynchospora pubera TaxID=906938 RepID=A0AAV8FQ19_9POAL|nr:cytochrome-c oxidase/ electron carrier [Rhynchospora pubera]
MLHPSIGAFNIVEIRFLIFPNPYEYNNIVEKKTLISKSIASADFRMSQTEAPFVPREKLLEKQRFFQNVQKHTYLKGRYDAITSIGIPLALAATSLFLIGRGIYNMSHGIGKKE